MGSGMMVGMELWHGRGTATAVPMATAEGVRDDAATAHTTGPADASTNANSHNAAADAGGRHGSYRNEWRVKEKISV